MKRVTRFRIAGLSAIFAPLIAFTSILLSIYHSPWFSWTENALSDLGAQGGFAEIIFNFGLIIVGLLVLVFASGIFEFLRENFLGRVGGLMLALDALSLSAIGIFPETAGMIHFYVSVSFFVLFPVSLILIGLAFVRISETNLALFTFIVVSITVFVWALPYEKGVAIPEALASLSASIWSIVLGFRLIKEASR
ncbi:MAG: DUF998 domain-containing protein [Nitrososphaerales archaeon]|nr:DUF998 domain-containing protein [Nitrososphaerales archaeon]